jgi:hypothetical protein
VNHRHLVACIVISASTIGSTSACSRRQAPAAQPEAETTTEVTSPARVVAIRLETSGLYVGETLASGTVSSAISDPPTADAIAAVLSPRLTAQSSCSVSLPSDSNAALTQRMLEGAAIAGCTDLSLLDLLGPTPIRPLFSPSDKKLPAGANGLFFEIHSDQVTCRAIQPSIQRDFEFVGETSMFLVDDALARLPDSCDPKQASLFLIETLKPTTSSNLTSLLARLHRSTGQVLSVAFREPAQSVRFGPESVQAAVRHAFPRFRACYAEGQRRNPTLAGTVVVHATVTPDGKVSDAKSIDPGKDGLAGLSDPAVAACVVREFRTLEFPPPSEPRSFDFPFQFGPD